MILTIKIQDNIHISEDKARDITFGGDYFEAQNLIKDIFKIEDDINFEIFVNAILNNFSFSQKVSNKAYNLYYLSDPVKIANSQLKIHQSNINYTSSNPSPLADSLLPSTNYLNYFGFVLAKFPTKAQFLVLNHLKTLNIIESYWVEGETFQPIIETASTPFAEGFDTQNITETQTIFSNQFEKDLQFSQLKNRGLGATVITFEESATKDLSVIAEYNSHLEGFKSNNFSVSTIGFFEAEIEIQHQLKTLVTLFAKKKENSIDQIFQMNGICSDANLIIGSVSPNDDQDYLGQIRRILVELNDSAIENAILLFEFVTNIYDKKDKKIVKTTLPPSVYKDINKQLVSLARTKNFIVVQGAGNLGINFDNANQLKDTVWNSDRLSYNNLSLNNPYIMMIGATCKDINGVFVYSNTNQSDNFDAYIYTEYAVYGKNDLIVAYGGTSGAVAVTAGIATYLQGRAIQEMTSPNLDGLINERFRIKKPFTVKIIKKAFENTFKKNLKNDIILTPITLENLWNECKKIALKQQ